MINTDPAGFSFQCGCCGVDTGQKNKTDNGSYVVTAAKRDTVSTTAYLLSNVLPLLAFDFTQYPDVIQFIVIFGFLAVLCLLHRRIDSNLCLELAGYRLYQCSMQRKNSSKNNVMVLIRKKQLNVNDEMKIHKINDELYIGEFVRPANG